MSVHANWNDGSLAMPLTATGRKLRYVLVGQRLILPTNGGHLTRRLHRLER